eukprot:gene2550-3156_t
MSSSNTSTSSSKRVDSGDNNNNSQEQQQQSTDNNNNNNSELYNSDDYSKYTSDKQFYKSWSSNDSSSTSSSSSSSTSTSELNLINNLSFVISSQIKTLLSNLTKKSYKSTTTELSQLINQYGQQSEIYLFRILIDSIDFKSSSSSTSSQKDQLKIQLFKDEFSRLLKQPHFISVICKALEGYENMTPEFLAQMSQTLKLSPSHEILLGLAQSQSLDKQTREHADRYLISTLIQLSQSNTKSLPENLLHQLLYKFKMQETSPQHHHLTTTPQYTEVLKYIQSICPPNSLALSPFIDNDNQQQNIPNSKRLQDNSPSYVNSLISKVSQLNIPHQVIQSIGFSSCSSAATLKDILSQFSKLSEPEVAMIIELYPNIDWCTVIKELDYPGFSLHDQRGLSLVLAIFKRAAPNEKFPVHFILDRVWTHTKSQLSFIKVALQSDFPFHLSQKKRVEYSSLGKVSQTVAHWNCLSLIEILLQLSEIDQDHYQKSRLLFDYPLKHCPELLLLGLASINLKNNSLQNELISLLFPALLHHNNQSYISQLWKEYPNLVVTGMSEIYQKDPSSLSRLLDIAQEIKILIQIVNFKIYPFVIELAVLASQREFLFLEKWLQERMKDDSQFVKACVSFLSDRINKKSKESATHVPISSAILVSFHKTLMSQIDHLPTDIATSLKQINPSSVSEGGDGERRFSSEIEDETNSYFIKLYSGEITLDQIINTLKEYKNSKNQREQEIFRCLLFNLFDEYKFLQDYPDKELRITGLLFGSLIKNQLISSHALRVALKYVLEGLKHQPNTNMFIFGLSALMSFASRLAEWPQYWSQICSIEHFKNNYGEFITRINSGIESSDPKTQEFQKSVNSPPSASILTNQQIQDAENFNFEEDDLGSTSTSSIVGSTSGTGEKKTKKQPTSTSPTTPTTTTTNPTQTPTPPPGTTNKPSPALTSPTTSGAPGIPPPPGTTITSPNTQVTTNEGEDTFSSSLPLGTLLSASKEIIQPDEATKDKIYFIINNISLHNLDAKTKELKDILKPEYQDFLAQYLVVKRVSIEANFHNLYLAFLDRLAIPDLFQKIVYYTHQNINTLLKSEKIRTDQSEKSLLKNLGGWMGMITLGKNKPLLQKLISPKDLLIYAVENGLLTSVVPFVSKLLDSCSQSRVFKPPNPWVMAIMRLFAEIYNLKESKNNIKFEIELLCNNLQLDLKTIKPTTIIAERRVLREQELEEQRFKEQQLQQQQQPQMPVHPSASDLLSNLHLNLQYNPSLASLPQLALIKKVFPIAFEKAIREIIIPVVERSVGIAVNTSKELVSKDFATEPDENKMKKASHLMVQNLAGSLAMVTCKDPLRVSIVTYLRSMLQQHSIEPLPAAFDHVLSMLCNDNLDFACSIVENAATEKAIGAIDTVLASSYMDRVKHKERAGPNQPFFDMGYLTTAIYNTLPELLRPKPGGIQPDQFRVYEDFLNLSHHPNISLVQPSSVDQSGLDNSGASGTSYSPPPQGSRTSSGVVDKNAMRQILAQQQGQQGQISTNLNKSPQEQQQQQMLQNQILQQQQQQFQQQQLQQQQQQQGQQTPTNQELLERFAILLNEVDQVIIRTISSAQQIDLDLLYTIAQKMINLIRLSANQAELIVGFLSKLFNRLVDPEKKLLYEIYFELLEVLRDLDQKVITNITNLLLYSGGPPDRKINRVLVLGLIIHQLINVNEYDQHLAKMMVDPTRSANSIDFAILLLRFCIVDNSYANLSEFPLIFEIITKIAQRSPSETLVKTIEDIKNAPKEEKKRRISRLCQEEMISDHPQLRDAVITLLKDWLLFSSANSDQKLLIQYLGQVLQIPWMKNELYFVKFLRIGIEWSLECYNANMDLPTPQYLDSYCKLLTLMVKHGDPTKIQVLTKVLAVLIKVLTKDYEASQARFNQRPYLRMFENLLVDLVAPDPILEQASPHILFCFVKAFAALQPQKYPAFCFAWLDLISHKSFMPKLLSKNQKSWFHTLLIHHLKFLDPFLRSTELSEPIKLLYKGTLKVLLVLLHDFPEFLCEFHFSFCDVIPTTCIQLRNLILSAFPRNMRLPDPFTPNLKVDLLPESTIPPKISSNFTQSLKNLKNEIDNYLKNRAPYSFLLELKSKYLLLSEPEEIDMSGTKYNAPLINSLVLYVATAIPQIQRKSNSSSTPTPSQSAMDIFHRLALDLDVEGRYLFLNAIANQLRFPNSHTHYFSCVLLCLFGDSTEIVKEQITRVLLERLISNKPHPWGLLITFIELIKNPRYNFWSNRFTKIAPEIEQLFDSVAKSCNTTTSTHS